jgi:hypothetical protein
MWIVALNAVVFLKGLVRRTSTPSPIPLLGGCAGVFALLTLPVSLIHPYWFVPLIVDWGGLPCIVYAIAWHLAKKGG